MVMEAIRRLCPDCELELVTMKTTGDKILDRSLDAIGGKGLFIKELDAALTEGRVDLCVHSYKDMPVEDDPRLPVVAVSPREDPRDVLLLPRGPGADEAAPLGCSSKRRQLQLKELDPDRAIAPVRGNVLTRLNKLDSGQFGGLVLAAAGIRRLGLQERIDRVFSPEEIIPAATQGILAVQGRAGEEYSYLAAWSDPAARDAARAERAFVRALDGGCTSPVAAHAVMEGDDCLLAGLYVNEKNELFRGRERGPRTEAEALGETLARRLKREGDGIG